MDEFDEDETEDSAKLAAWADGAIPDDAIRLSEAFARVQKAAEETPAILRAIPEWAEDNVEMTIQTLREKEKSWEPEDRTTEVHIKAACLFRIALYESLQAYVYDTDYGKTLKLNPEGWFFCDERVPIHPLMM